MKALRHTPAAPSRCASAPLASSVPPRSAAAFARALHPWRHIVVGRLEGQHHDGDRTICRAGVVGLGRIEDAAVRGIEAGLRDRAHGAGCGKEILETHRAAVAEFRAVLQAHPRLCDDAENSFRADHHAVRTRARAGTGQAAAFDHASRRDGAQRFDEIVDVGIERREVAAAARRNPAAERRVFEALREMAQREPVRAKLRFERRAVGAALDQRGARGLVDLLHFAHLAQVDRDRALVAVALRLDAAAHARPAAERRHGRVDAAGPVEHGLHVRLVARIGDDVGRARIIACKAADELGVRFAVGVRGTVVVFAGAERERGGRRDARSIELDVFEARRARAFLQRRAETRFRTRHHEGLFFRCEALALAAPAEVFQPRC